jgi:thiol-disulfide isomerase/thioredoxin
LEWNRLRPDERDEFTEQLPSYFEGRALDETDLETSQQVAQAVLSAGDRPAAIAIYRSLADVLSKSSQPEIVAEAGKLAGMAHRLESLGQEISIEATRLDGQPLDWASYRGKIVLLDYWATWCGPCIAEIPNIRHLYDVYRERGFDVIGVSVDTDKEELQSFVEKNEIPWAVTYYAGEDSPGMAQPLAVQFGVSTIPVALLVDQEGRLIALEARGDELADWLERMLGPADIAQAASIEEPTSEATASKPTGDAPAEQEKTSEEKTSEEKSKEASQPE